MVRGPSKLFNLMTLALALAVGVIPTAVAAPVISGDMADNSLLYMGILFVFAAGLILWVALDRKRLRDRLIRVERDNYRQSLLLNSRKGLSVTWDKQGEISPLDDIKNWLGIDSDRTELDCLRGEAVAFSQEQFDLLTESLEKLLAYGESFRRVFFLEAQKRNIVVTGEPLTDGHISEGSIVWFREATAEENIAAFKERDVRNISKRLNFFENTGNLMQLPMWLRDENLKLIWVNKAYVDAVDGASADEVISEGLELITSTIGKTARDTAAMARETHEVYKEKHFVVIRGERRALDIYNIPVRIDKDNMGCMGYAQDITELEKARGELIHHTESHSETLNKLSTAVAIFTSGKRLEYYNSAFSRLWHLSDSLLLNHPLHGELLEAMREARRLPEQANFPEWKAAQLAAYTHILDPVEEMWHLPDNTSLRVVTQPHPLGGLLVFYEDVTDNFALERSYNTLFAVQKETMNNLHEGLAVFGIDGCLQLYNDAFLDIWKLSRDFLDGAPHTAEVMDSCAENYGSSHQITELKNLIVGGEVKKEISSGRLKRQDGSVLDYSVVPLPDGATLITFINVSDSFAIEKALRERNQALEEADKIKADFLAHMSYELRTPLNSIIGFSELLEKEYQGPLNDVQHGYMHNILAASRQLLELFNDILDLSVIEAGGLTLDIDQFEVPSVLTQVVGQLQERIKVKDIDLLVDNGEKMSPVWGDSKRIQHAIYNLLSNAVKFTPSHGTINLAVRQDNLNYIIIIQDSGVGIRPEEIHKIFEKFFTGSNVPNEHGAGLGLSLVRSFVELHGGKIEVQSSLNEGTCMTLTLPVRIGLPAQISVAGE